MGQIVSIPMNISKALVVLFAVFEVLNKIVANTETRGSFDTPNFYRTNMKGGGQNRG